MLALRFHLQNIPYLLACRQVKEIIPLVSIKPVPHAPDFFAGFINYRGAVVPLIDLGVLIQETACRHRLSTRIILVDYSGKAGVYPLGLIAEQVIDILSQPAGRSADPSVQLEKAPYLGEMVMIHGEMIQTLRIEKLPDCLGFVPSSRSGEEADGIQPD